MPNAPLFDNNDIFGRAVVIEPRPGPPDIQVSAFGGVNGLDLLLMGSRGTILHCTGLLWAPSYQGLVHLLETWRSYTDVGGGAGTGYQVVDTVDRIWNYCLIRSPLTQGSRMIFDRIDPLQLGNNTFAFPYQLEILAPVPPILPALTP